MCFMGYPTLGLLITRKLGLNQPLMLEINQVRSIFLLCGIFHPKEHINAILEIRK